MDLGLVGQQLGQQSAQPDGFGDEVLPTELVARRRGVALVEDQIDDREDRAEAVGQLGVAGHPVRDPGLADLAFGPHQALGHGRLRHQEGAGDRPGLQAAQQTEGEGHLRLDRQRRMAAGEDQAQSVVAHGTGLLGGLVDLV